MPITFNFEYGTSEPIDARLIFRRYDWLIPSVSSQEVPVECKIMKSPQGGCMSSEWETASLEACPNMFVDAFADLAYRYIQMQEALGRGPYSKVIARPGQNQCLTYRKRADAVPAHFPAHFPAARWATIEIQTGATDGVVLQCGRDINVGRLYEHPFRAAVVELLRNEIRMKLGHGLLPDAPLFVLLSTMRKEAARFPDIATLGLIHLPNPNNYTIHRIFMHGSDFHV